jgi:hypothetical protein
MIFTTKYNISLYSDNVMILGEVMVTQCTDGELLSVELCLPAFALAVITALLESYFFRHMAG